MSLWIALILNVSTAAAVGTATSGGGGAFVWRDSNGAVTQAKLIDLWEAENIPFNWPDQVGTIRFQSDATLSTNQLIAASVERLSAFDENLAVQVQNDLVYLKAHQHPLVSSISIQLPEDLRVAYFPSGSLAEGMMRFNGITGFLDINREIFAHILEPLELAATWLHEAIYKSLRESVSAHQDSVLARHLNACLLSSSTTCLSTPAIRLPEDRWVFKCTGAVADYYVYPLSKNPPYDPAGYRVEFLRLGNGHFAYETFQEVHLLEFHADGTITARSAGANLHGALDDFNYSPGSVSMSLSLDYQGFLKTASISEALSAPMGGTKLNLNGVDHSICTQVH